MVSLSEMRSQYTSDEIRTAVEGDRERLFASWSVGRPENWNTDQRTKDVVCIGNWMGEEMVRFGLDDAGRRALLHEFNRYCRNDEDLFFLSAEIMNDMLAGNIVRNRRHHRRWG